MPGAPRLLHQSLQFHIRKGRVKSGDDIYLRIRIASKELLSITQGLINQERC